MTPDPISEGNFDLLCTESPQEYVVQISVSKHDLKPALMSPIGTAYKDARLMNKPRVAEFGSYVLTGTADGPPGYIYVWFAQPKTDEEKWTAVRPTQEDPQVETWPDILEGLRFVEDDSAPIAVRAPDENATSKVGTIFVNRKVEFKVITPETTATCQALVEVYQADTPFTGLSYPQPTPGHVEWNFGAAGAGSFVALHPDIVIERPASQYRVVADATPGFVDAPFNEKLIFPATKFKTWRPITKVQTGYERGIYKLKRWTIFPPPKPKPVYRS